MNLRVWRGPWVLALGTGCAFSMREFHLRDYVAMREDEARTRAYYKAIDALPKNSVVLDLGTGALALLAKRAARAAKHVYAIEASPSAAEAARMAVRGEPITVISGRSQDSCEVVRQSNGQDIQLPPVDFVVHEILGEIASREGGRIQAEW